MKSNQTKSELQAASAFYSKLETWH